MLQVKKRAARSVTAVTFDGTILSVKSDYFLTRIGKIKDDILRVTVTRKDAFLNKPSDYILPHEFMPAKAEETDEFVLFHAGLISARVHKADGHIEFLNADGNLLIKEGVNKTLEAFDAYKISADRPIVTEEIETADGKKTVVRESGRDFYKTLYRARLPLMLDEGEAIYGFGQSEHGPGNLRNRKLYLCQANRSIAVPCFVSTAGYGILLNVGCPIIFNGDTEKPYIYAEAVEEMDYYIAGGNCDQVVKNFHFLSGKPPLLPRWAFGYVQSQERYETQEEILSIARECRERGIGLDLIVLDWCSWPDGQWGQKTFDRQRFPKPDEMILSLHDQHVRFMISMWPNSNKGTENYAEFSEKKQLLPGTNIYDASNPEARETYWQQAKRDLFANGVDAWWCDSSEPWTTEWGRKEEPESEDVYRETYETGAKSIGADRAAAYSFYHAKTMWDGQRACTDEKRVVNLTRAGWTGAQRFGTILWSGDISAKWSTFKSQVAVGPNMSASGFPYWTLDIGGFFVKKGEAWYWDGDFDDAWENDEFQELFTRWYQYALFLPIFRGHGTDTRRELWNARGEYYDALVKANNARYELIPYLYSLAARAAREGGTIMKPLGFAFPNDAAARDVNDQYLLGDDMMVCPVTDYRARARKVYLPEGKWYRMGEKSECLEGGRYIEVGVEIDEVCVFIRAGAVIPMLLPALSVDEAYENDYIVRVFPGADGAFDIYEDAGDGYGYEKGECAWIPLRWSDSKRSLEIGKAQGAYPGMKDRKIKVEIMDK